MGESIDAVLVRAAQLTADGRPRAAIELLRPVLVVHPEHSAAWCRISVAYLDAGELNESLDAAKRAITLGERSWAHRLASLALVELGRYPEAVASAREAVRRDPIDWRCHVALAEALSATAPDDSIAAARKAVELAPHESRPHEVLGDAAVRARDTTLARRAYRDALHLDPDNDHIAATLTRLGPPTRPRIPMDRGNGSVRRDGSNGQQRPNRPSAGERAGGGGEGSDPTDRRDRASGGGREAWGAEGRGRSGRGGRADGDRRGGGEGPGRTGEQDRSGRGERRAVPARAGRFGRGQRTALWLLVRRVGMWLGVGSFVLIVAGMPSPSPLLVWFGLALGVFVVGLGGFGWLGLPHGARAGWAEVRRVEPLIPVAAGLVALAELLLVVWTVALALGSQGMQLLSVVLVCSGLSVAIGWLVLRRLRVRGR